MSLSVSIIIPVYQRTEYLDDCLKSCVASTHMPCEIIIVDDGNVPSVAHTIAKTAEKYAARVITLKENMGAAAARNAGAKSSRGDALFFADADIKLLPGALALLVEVLERNPSAAFAYGDYEFGTKLMKADMFSLEKLQRVNYISTMSLVRKNWFVGFDESLRRFQDWDLWLSIAEKGGVGIYVPATVCQAVPGGSMSTWLPSIIAKNPHYFMWIPRVKHYYTARRIILQKHHL